MHPYRGIVRTHIMSDGLYMRPDGLNTLTLQPSGTNNYPRKPLSWTLYMESCPDMALLYSTDTDTSTSTSTVPETPPPLLSPRSHRHNMSPPIGEYYPPLRTLSLAKAVSLITFLTQSDS